MVKVDSGIFFNESYVLGFCKKAISNLAKA